MAKATEPPAAQYVVLHSFAAFADGVPTIYTEGELVHPDDPFLKTMPDKFGPVVYPHPVRRSTSPRVEQATAAPGEKRGGS